MSSAPTVAREGAVAVVEIGDSSLDALVTALSALSADIRAVLLRLPGSAPDPTGSQRGLAAVEALPLPTVALLGAHCSGPSLDLALCCDVRVAPVDVVVAAAAPNAATLPAGGTVARLVRTTGQGVARDMLLTGRPVAADDALAWGLVTRLSTSASTDALELATTIAALSPEALAATKRLALGASEDSYADGLTAELSSWRTVRDGANAQEGLSAFAEKRTPRFT
ncbi:MAG: hypothetical protein J0I34_16520 [Pseudonocardia sp.]|uniref:enoyl-CoA hydratase/isomerase family protein n=1 Tax=unclassified Pseudonocardia TaxID=2619320 RepID=UPI00086B30E5|nr:MULTISPECIES: enoyl-CoA hydratase-related protein [unclassified Pseudonocardia]MBN9110370.1 hypothetical protein [Pseudonocardia sp.]ODU04819.1 MAG: hypothetical protein ABS80_25660 [Pseudonocardia sp. SCN 72-51]ODV03875.1 MAG: hypothetical protein ABT15_21745 [Pseudonocardia sp. SCN 73-27]